MGQVLGLGKSRLPLLARFTYSVGHVLNDLCAAMWFSYLLVYFHSILRFSNVMAGYVMFLGQVSDAICTPLVGYESDNTVDRCRYGNRKSWHLIGTVCVITTFAFIFNTPIGGQHSDDWAKFIYYAPFVVIFQFGWACTQISHLSLIPELTACESERVGLNALRYSFTVMSSIFVYGITWLLLSQSAGTVTTAAPPNKNGHLTDNSLASNIPEFRTLSLIVVGVGAFFALIFHIGTKEKCLDENSVTSLSGTTIRRNNLYQSMKWTCWLKQIQFYQVAALYMCSRLMVNISQVYIPMYVTETLGLNKESIAIVPLVIYVSGWLSTFLMKLVNKLLGRKMTYFLGVCFFLAGCNWLWADGIGMQVYGAAVFLGVGGSTVLVTSLSMTADLIGQNTETGAFVYGAMSFTDKLSNGIVIVIIQQLHPCLNCCSACHLYYQKVIVYAPGGAAILALVILASLAPRPIGHRRKKPVPMTDDSLINNVPNQGTTSPVHITSSVNQDAKDNRLLNKGTEENGEITQVQPTCYGSIDHNPEKV